MEPECQTTSVRLLAGMLTVSILYSSQLGSEKGFGTQLHRSIWGALFKTKQKKTTPAQTPAQTNSIRVPGSGPPGTGMFSKGDFNVQPDWTSTALN